MTGLGAESGKILYKELDCVAHASTQRDRLANLMIEMLGLRLERHKRRLVWVRDPEKQTSADAVVRRWLRDNGYIE